uniref:Uncharacterized protein n=1 Tax=Panagrolaimus superbus TaxID=310955 RepID=A0A914Y727_9BILA
MFSSFYILNENESVANWNYCTEQWDCKDQPCHCPFPVIYDSSSENALNITAQLQNQTCKNPLQDCGCYYGLCVCAWECGKSRTEMKSSATLDFSY